MIPQYLLSPEWSLPFAILVGVCVLLLVWSYTRSRGPILWRGFCALCKTSAVALLGLCLLEPMRITEVPQTGANKLFIVADASSSLQIQDKDFSETREEQLRRVLTEDKSWQDSLNETFDVRRYTVGSELVANEFADYAANEHGSTLSAALNELGRRYQSQPSAAVILLTDGNDTHPMPVDTAALPPVYPVVLGSDSPMDDLGITRTAVSQTNFEAAPVSVTVDIEATGFKDQLLDVVLVNREDHVVAAQTILPGTNAARESVRFQFRPRQPGTSSYRAIVQPADGQGITVPESNASANADEDELDLPQFVSRPSDREATLENNERHVVVNRARGPYRVLYVSGRPNWEFKFLRRAMQADDEVDLVGLIRIAREEPKFTFRSRRDERTNPLFRGFGNDEDEEAEQYNEPVLVRVGTRNAEELRGGFPESPEELFEYDAVVLDDVEAAFFTQEQMSLIEKFVSQRGGGLLMLGGQESFVDGGYDRTPIGEVLPVWLDNRQQTSPDTGYRLTLTRAGWLQPWLRTESTEPDEQQRLDQMPGFATLNQMKSVKPGAQVLAYAETIDGTQWPALVEQRFGRGRAGAILIGDMWRWALDTDEGETLLKSWRQTIRWLVSDVPRRVEPRIVEPSEADQPGNHIEISILGPDYLAAAEATVTTTISRPDGTEVTLTARPDDSKPGIWQIDYLARQNGPYFLKAVAEGPDGKEMGRGEMGWVADAAALEFARLAPNRDAMARLAADTGGRVLELSELDALAAELPQARAPVMERKDVPWWHTPWVMAIAIGLLAVEWGVRRWQGMP